MKENEVLEGGSIAQNAKASGEVKHSEGGSEIDATIGRYKNFLREIEGVLCAMPCQWLSGACRFEGMEEGTKRLADICLAHFALECAVENAGLEEFEDASAQIRTARKILAQREEG